MLKTSPAQLHMASYAAMQDTLYNKTGWAREFLPRRSGGIWKDIWYNPDPTNEGHSILLCSTALGHIVMDLNVLLAAGTIVALAPLKIRSDLFTLFRCLMFHPLFVCLPDSWTSHGGGDREPSHLSNG